MTTESPATTVAQLAEQYGDAWNRRDLDAILALHAEGSVFDMNVGGEPPAKGKAAVREAFAGLFATWPDISFETRRLYLGDDHFVHEWTAGATLAQSVSAAGRIAEPEDRRIRFNGVDVIAVEGLRVKRKDTYLDLATIERELGLRPVGEELAA